MWALNSEVKGMKVCFILRKAYPDFGQIEMPEDHQFYTDFELTRKYLLHGYILGSGALGTPGVTPKTY